MSEASLFMSMVVLGGFSFQWPIGMLADRHDRRLVLSGALVTAGVSWPLLASLTASGLPLLGLLAIGSVVRRGDQQRLPDMRRTNLRPPQAQTLCRGGRAAPAVLCIRGDGWPLAHVDDHGDAGPVQLLRVRNRRGNRLHRLRRLSRPQASAAAYQRAGGVRRGAERDPRRHPPRSSHWRGRGRTGSGRDGLRRREPAGLEATRRGLRRRWKLRLLSPRDLTTGDRQRDMRRHRLERRSRIR